MSNQEKAKEWLSQGWSVRKVARELRVDHTTVIYWRDRNFSVREQNRSCNRESATCIKCGRFYTLDRSKNNTGSTCNSCRRSTAQKKKKDIVVGIVGHACIRCGYVTQHSMDYHHVHPNEKSTLLSACIRLSSIEDTIAEAHKCIPLCANCHREYHAGQWCYNSVNVSLLKDYQRALVLSAQP